MSGRDRQHRLTWRDRTWAPFTTVRALGPVSGLDAAAVGERLDTLHRTEPGSPLVGVLDRGRARVRAVPPGGWSAHRSRVLLTPPRSALGAGPATPEGMARWLLDLPDDDLPLVVAVCEGVIAVRSSHAIGDGATLLPVLYALAGRDGPGPGALLPRTTRAPVLRAAWRTFGARPWRVLPAARRAVAGSGGGRGGPALAPSGTVLVTGVLPPAELARVRQHRAAGAPSVAAVLMVRARAALAEVGLDAPGVHVMVDCRRYLPPGATVAGNFATGPYLAVPRSATAPVFAAALARAVADGVPLALLAALGLRIAARGGRPPLPVTRSNAVHPRITLTHQGRTDLGGLPVEHLPSSAAGPPLVVASQPAGPAAITLGLIEGPTGVYVAVTADRAVASPEQLRAAVRTLCDGGGGETGPDDQPSTPVSTTGGRTTS